MENIFLDVSIHMPIQVGVRNLQALAFSGIDHGAKGCKPVSEAPEYGAGYASAALLAAAERRELIVSAAELQDENGALVGYWVLYGPGAPDSQPEPMEMAELSTLTATGLRIYNAYGNDLTDSVYTLH